MIIKTLVENTALSKDFGSEHGLSLYIETNGRKTLFDVGASGLFLKNAIKMNVNIPDVDYLIISHGHYDHGGGLKVFLRENTKAEVFLHRLAFEKYYALRSNTDRLYLHQTDSLSAGGFKCSQILLKGYLLRHQTAVYLWNRVGKKCKTPLITSKTSQ